MDCANARSRVRQSTQLNLFAAPMSTFDQTWCERQQNGAQSSRRISDKCIEIFSRTQLYRTPVNLKPINVGHMINGTTAFNTQSISIRMASALGLHMSYAQSLVTHAVASAKAFGWTGSLQLLIENAAMDRAQTS